MQTLYTAIATSTGGRDGRAISSDNILDVKLATPKELGGAGGAATNPEQLFAAGYSACFIGALKFVASQSKRKIADDASITAHVGNDYKRVRIGVGKPPIKEMVPTHVLSDFAKSERPWVEALCDIIADNAGLLVEGKDSSFQNKVHLAMDAKGFGDGTDAD